MKTFTPEIAWHNRDPVYSVDIQSRIQESPSQGSSSSTIKWYRLATSGADSQVIIWKVWNRSNSPGSVGIEPISQLTRHEKAVNVVRFTPTGDDVLASADVDGIIIIWKLGSQEFNTSPRMINLKPKVNDDDVICLSSQSDNGVDKFKRTNGNKNLEEDPIDNPMPNLFEEDTIKVEVWTQWKTLRGHLEDVVDVGWSSDGNMLVSASVDNEAIVWDVVKGVKLHMLSGHKSWVQGVSFDPNNEYLVSLCADRNLRVYNCATRKFMYKVEKGSVLHEDESSVKTKLFYDYTLPSFTRRLAFSPGGEFLLAPSGVIELPRKQVAEKDLLELAGAQSGIAGAQNGIAGGGAKVKSSEIIEIVIDDDDDEVAEMKMPDEERDEPMDADNEAENGGDEICEKDKNLESESASPKPGNGSLHELSETPKRKKKKVSPRSENQKVEKKVENSDDLDTNLGYINVCHLFLRQDLKRPFCYYPTLDKFCHAVQFCPIRFKLQSPNDIEMDFPYPYRIIFAIATQSSVILYDTSQLDPFGYIADIHYARISDLSWSPDGRLLMISSTDGFCTFVTFDDGELGEVYDGPTFVWEPNVSKLGTATLGRVHMERQDCRKLDTKQLLTMKKDRRTASRKSIGERILDYYAPVVGRDEALETESGANDAELIKRPTENGETKLFKRMKKV